MVVYQKAKESEKKPVNITGTLSHGGFQQEFFLLISRTYTIHKAKLTL
jgi:hypothetical protein